MTIKIALTSFGERARKPTGAFRDIERGRKMIFDIHATLKHPPLHEASISNLEWKLRRVNLFYYEQERDVSCFAFIFYAEERSERKFCTRMNHESSFSLCV